MKRVLAVASGGGHWIQLLRLTPAFAGTKILYMSTAKDLAEMVEPEKFTVVRDASQNEKFGLIIMALQILWQILRFRPHFVLSTGAAPGFFAIFFGKMLGAKTIWIDSIANSEELSLTCRKVRPWCDHWLTQWPDLAQSTGAEYWGSVL